MCVWVTGVYMCGCVRACVCVCVCACVRACVCVCVLLTNYGCMPSGRGDRIISMPPPPNCRVWQLLLHSCSLIHGASCCFPNSLVTLPCLLFSWRAVYFLRTNICRNVANSSADSPSGSIAGVEHFGVWQNIETEAMLRWRTQYGNNSEIPSSLVSQTRMAASSMIA